MVRRWYGKIETLQHAVAAERYIWVFCLWCGHAGRLDPRPIAMRRGNLRLEEIGALAKCDRCGVRGGALVAPAEMPLPGRG